MYPNQTKRTSLLLEFTYPKYHNSKNSYIDFCAYDPLSNKMRRKKYMLDHMRKPSEREKRAAEMIEQLLTKLRSGWNPWIDASSNRSFTQFEEIIRLYNLYVDRLQKKHTQKTYRSGFHIFCSYLKTRIVKIKYIYQIDSVLINDFLDWSFYDREVSARTRNNYRLWASTFCGWLVSKKYLNSNPVEEIKEIAEDPKIRQPLSREQLKKLNDYLTKTDKYFLLACQMEYYTFIRPTELTYIRLSDISIKEQSVFVSGDISKNGKSAKVGLNEEIIRLMIELDIFSSPGSYFLFGRDFRPCIERSPSDIFYKAWAKLRGKLKIGKSYQFYSLKDSGIRDLANSAGIVIARDQARHSDVATTNKYLLGRETPIHGETKNFKGYL